MRTLGIIALTAVLTTPVAALAVTKVLTEPLTVGQLSVDENSVFEIAAKGKKERKGSAPLFDEGLDSQRG